MSVALKSENELITERRYHQKVYANGNEKRFIIHTAHIHYKDDDGLFKEIDTKLSFDGTNFIHPKASFEAKFPEFADGKFDFKNRFEGADHTISMIPQVAHIKGEAFGNYILYKDAFGAGLDLKVYAYHHGVKEIVVINKPSDKDLTFDFELVLNGHKVNGDSEWDKKSKLDFKGKTLKIGEEGKGSYFRNATVWDSAQNSQPVDIELYEKGNKIFLRKTVSKEFLEKSVFPVYTDHATTFFSGSGDGQANANDDVTDWTLIHDGGGTAASATATSIPARSKRTTVPVTQILIVRAFIPFNTSGLTGTISSATINLYGIVFSAITIDDDDNNFAVIVQTTQNDPNTVVLGDYQRCGAIDNPTEGSNRIDNVSEWVTGAYNTFTLNATGLGWILRSSGDPIPWRFHSLSSGLPFIFTSITSGIPVRFHSRGGTVYSRFGVREGHDALDDPLAGNTESTVFFSTSEETGTGQDPYLDVTTV